MTVYKDISDLKKQIADFKRAVHSTNSDYLTGYICALSVVEGMIAELPDADVVELVRCKDCKHREKPTWVNGYRCGNPDSGMASGVELRDYDFCSYGERKDNA